MNIFILKLKKKEFFEGKKTRPIGRVLIKALSIPH
jgi:hypothetical protein